jgi:hypothetical protein
MTDGLVGKPRRGDVWARITILFLFGFAAANTLLRVARLGYSNFQGDEVKAQEYLFGNEGILQFLLTRSKGPLQFLVSYAMNGIALGRASHPEGALRAPFALAGMLSVGAIYFLGARYWSRRSGVIAAFFLAASGLFLALSRAVQYQSFVILLSILTYHEFLGHLKDGEARRLIIAGVLSGVALLFHYDAVSFIAPITLYMSARCLRSEMRWRSLATYLLPLGLVSGLFYVPYILNPAFPATVAYLLGERITSEFRFDSLYYGLRLLTIYHSREFLILLVIGLSLFAAARARIGGHIAVFLVALLGALVAGRIVGVERVGALVYGSVLASAALIGGLLVHGNPGSNRERADVALTLWLLVPFTAYGLWFAKPLTHIYTFLTPLFLALGVTLEPALQRIPRISLAVALVAGVSATSFNYQAFVNATPEYPWNSKTYIFGKMSTAISSGEAIQGIFGFPYNRDWWEIRSEVEALGVSTYASNEKMTLTRYYLNGLAWDEERYQVYIWIDKPQSLSRQPMPAGTPLAEGSGFALFVPR